MTIEDDIAFLERVPTFAVLGREALRILAIGAESRYIHSGEVLFTAGAPADAGYLVQEGSLALRPAEPRDETAAMTAARGVLLGEIAMFIETIFPVTAVAVEPSTVIRIPRSLFLKMLDGFPEAARRLRDHMAARTTQMTKDIQGVRTLLDPRNERG